MRSHAELDCDSGMATALCLLLVGLLLSVCLSLSLFLEVEHAAGYRQTENLQLRQHARLALRLAAGTLQAHLGPDSRANARADSQACPARWIGVWETDVPETSARWLVSIPSLPAVLRISARQHS